MKILLVGGSKSGKSGLAQQIAVMLSGGNNLYYWATMEPTDDEDDSRISRHVSDRRGMGFITIERGRNILGLCPESGSTVLFDSLTALLANEMFASGFDPNAAERAASGILILSDRVENFICVCDDIFRDGSNYEQETDAYVRGLALICRRAAENFDVVCEVVGGIPRELKGTLPVISN